MTPELEQYLRQRNQRGGCDKCGVLATSLARDIQRCEEPGETWVRYKSVGEIKRGCDKHPARSMSYGHDGNLRGRVTDDQGRPIF